MALRRKDQSLMRFLACFKNLQASFSYL